jgi:hypothetical protein
MSDLYYFNGFAEERRDMQPVSTQPVVSQYMVYVDLQDERVQDVVGRVQRAISEKYPDAEFATYIGTQPLGVYIDVYTERDEFRGILQVLDDRLGNLYIAAGVAVCVQPRMKAQVRAA